MRLARNPRVSRWSIAITHRPSGIIARRRGVCKVGVRRMTGSAAEVI
jgi:hypothetical protein